MFAIVFAFGIVESTHLQLKILNLLTANFEFLIADPRISMYSSSRMSDEPDFGTLATHIASLAPPIGVEIGREVLVTFNAGAEGLSSVFGK
jgi:hypothetical protein